MIAWIRGLRPHVHADEDGAIAVTTAVTLVALFGVAMMAVDGGSVWTSRRNVIADTDAAALAAARLMLDGDCNATTRAAAEVLALESLADNDTLTSPDGDPAIVCSGAAGRVAVAATRETSLAFGGMFGFESSQIASTSLAQYGWIAGTEGLRPIALCNKDAHVLEAMIGANDGWDWDDIADLFPSVDIVGAQAVAAGATGHPVTGPDGPYTGTVHRLHFTRDELTPACGSASGNWGWLDFAGNGNSQGNNSVQEWIEFGYPGTITVGDEDFEDCAPEIESEQDCIGEPGAGGNSWNSALEAIYCPSDLTAGQCAAQQLAFPVIIFDSVSCANGQGGGGQGGGGQGGGGQGGGGQGGQGGGGQGGGGQGGQGGQGGVDGCTTGGGGNARYDHTAFLGVILRDWSSITGNLNAASYFDFEFVHDFITDGSLTGTPSDASGLGLKGLNQCGGGYGDTLDNFCTLP